MGGTMTIDDLAAKLDAQGAKLDALSERMDQRFDTVAKVMGDLRHETSQGFIQMNQKIQDMTRRRFRTEPKKEAVGQSRLELNNDPY